LDVFGREIVPETGARPAFGRRHRRRNDTGPDEEAEGDDRSEARPSHAGAIVRGGDGTGTLGRMSDDEPATEGAKPSGGRTAPACSHCGGETMFAGGESTHDLYAERFVCRTCGGETYRSFGRGSVS
jgi:hypothetical protein